MVSILHHNARELLQYLINTFNNFENSLYLKYQLKTMIYLYFTDKQEASVDQYYYKNPFLCTLFCKYVKYLKHQMFCFKHIISANKEIIYIDTTNVLPPPLSFTEKKFLFETKKKPSAYQKSYITNNNCPISIPTPKTFLKKEEISKIIIDFMKPYNNLKNPVSIVINELILDTIKYEKEKKTSIKNINNNELSQLLFQMSLLQSKIHNFQLCSNPTLQMIESHKILLNEHANVLFKYTNESDKLRNVNIQLSFSLKNEKKYKYQKEYCKRTILLNIDLMKTKLNGDVISYIKTFLNPIFLENIRKSSIQKKHFKFPQEKMSDLLYTFSLKQILKICKNNLFLLYNSIKIEEDHFLNDNEDNMLTNDYIFMNYFENMDCHPLFDSNILLIRNKKKIIKKIISNHRFVHYYEFQREIFILHKIICWGR
jgi:hypothetical protein